MKTKKSILYLFSAITLFAFSIFLNTNQFHSSCSNGVSLEKILQAYSASAEDNSGCTGTTCDSDYDYNDGPLGTIGCCRKYTTSTGKKG